ncbi:ribonuclease D [Alteromonas halophila]|nr:ribonuclease D [Alteromonas halophila]
MHYSLITTSDALSSVCDQARTKDAVALDTEFVRTRTLTPQLGLIQLYDGDQLVLIDPLAIDDMAPMVALLSDTSTIKVLHACSEDLEAFNSALGVIPEPVFDTQFAAGILGMGAAMGYARLIEALCAKTLDKGESRTDWLARPLSPRQLEYAANDVLYLLPAYMKLKDQIDDINKTDWVFREVATIAAKKRATIPPGFAYLQIKNNWRLSPRQLQVLQALAAWRVSVAVKKDLALNFVFKENHLFDVASVLPASKTALSKIHGLNPHTIRRYGEVVVDIVSDSLRAFDNAPEQDHLPVVQRLIDIPEYKKTLNALKTTTTSLAVKYGVAPEIMASKKQLNQLLKWYWFELDETRAQGLMPDVLSGWRQRYFEEPVRALLGPYPSTTVSVNSTAGPL